MLQEKIKNKGGYLNGAFLESLIKDVGFVDVEVKYMKLYSGTWAYDGDPSNMGQVDV